MSKRNSSSYDERVMTLKFDNSEFEKGAKQTLESVKKLNKGLDGVDVDKYNKSVEKLSKTFKSYSTEVSNNKGSEMFKEGVGYTEDMNSQIYKMSENTGLLRRVWNLWLDEAAAGIKKITGLLPGLFSEFYGPNGAKAGFSEYQQQITATQTILSNTKDEGKSISDITAALDELNEFADLTIYNFTQMTENIGRFTAAGVKLEPAVTAIKGIANLGAISGSTSQQVNNAMYQLSQALAAGTVRLQDWRSVVNAGMGGKSFQDELMTTAKVHKKLTDSMMKNTKRFQDSLSKGWLTSDILTETLEMYTVTTKGLTDAEIQALRATWKSRGYTEEQIDHIIELGEDAMDASTKVKTLTQLWSTFQESAGSGWAKTWQLIVGDFEEAGTMWTAVKDAIDPLIQGPATWRNNLLQETLKNSGYDQLISKLNEAGVTASGLEKAIVAIGGDSIEAAIKKSGNLAAAIRDGSIDLKDYASTINTLFGGANIDLSDKMEGYSRKKGATYKEEVKKLQDYLIKSGFADGLFTNTTGFFGQKTEAALKKWQEANGLEGTGILDKQTLTKLKANSDDISSEVGVLLNNLNQLGGREKILEGIANMFTYLRKAAEPVGKAITDIFPLPTAESLTKLINKFHDWASALTITEEQAEKIRKRITQLLRPIRSLWNVVSAVYNQFKKVVTAILNSPAVTQLKTTFGTAFDFLCGILDQISDALDNAAEVINNSDVVKYITDFIDGIINAIAPLANSAIAKGLDVLKNIIGSITEVASPILEAGKIKAGNLFSGVGDVFSNLWNNVLGPLRKTIGKVVPTMGEVANGMRAMDTDLPFIINWFSDKALLIGGALAVIKPAKALGQALYQVVDSASSILEIGENLNKIIKNAKRTIIAFNTNLWMKGISKILLSIAGLAAVVFLGSSLLMSTIGKLATVEPGRLWNAFFVFAATLAVTVGIVALLAWLFGANNKMPNTATKNGSNLPAVISQQGGLAGIKENIKNGLSDASKIAAASRAKVSGLLAVSGALVLMAAAVNLMIRPITKLAQYDPDHLWGAVKTVGAVILLLAGAVALISLVISKIKFQNVMAKQLMAMAVIFTTFSFIIAGLARSIAMMAKFEPARLAAAGTVVIAYLVVMVLVFESLFKYAAINKLGTPTALASMTGVLNSFAGFIGSIGMSLMLFAMAMKVLGTMSTEAVVQGGVAAVAIIGTMILLYVMLQKMTAQFPDAKSGIAGQFGKFFSIGIQKTQVTQFITFFVSMAAALNAMAVCIGLLGSMKIGVLVKGIAAIAAVIAVMVGMYKLVAKIDVTSGYKLQAFMLSLGLALGAITACITILGAMNIKMLLRGILGITLVVEAMIVMYKQVSRIPAKGSGMFVLFMAGLGGGLYLMTAAIALMGTIDPAKFAKSIMMIGVVCVAVAELYKKVSLINKMYGTGLKTSALGIFMLMLGAGLALMAVPIAIFGSMSIESLIKGIAAVMVLMTAIQKLFKTITAVKWNGIGKAWAQFVPQILLMASIAGALTLLAVPMSVFASMNVGQLVQSVAVIVALGVVLKQFMKFIYSLPIKGENWAQVAMAILPMVTLAFTVFILAHAIQIMGELSPQQMARSVLIFGFIGACMLGLLGIAKVAGKIGDLTVGAIGKLSLIVSLVGLLVGVLTVVGSLAMPLIGTKISELLENLKPGLASLEGVKTGALDTLKAVGVALYEFCKCIAMLGTLGALTLGIGTLSGTNTMSIVIPLFTKLLNSVVKMAEEAKKAKINDADIKKISAIFNLLKTVVETLNAMPKMTQIGTIRINAVDWKQLTEFILEIVPMITRVSNQLKEAKVDSTAYQALTNISVFIRNILEFADNLRTTNAYGGAIGKLGINGGAAFGSFRENFDQVSVVFKAIADTTKEILGTINGMKFDNRATLILTALGDFYKKVIESVANLKMSTTLMGAAKVGWGKTVRSGMGGAQFSTEFIGNIAPFLEAIAKNIKPIMDAVGALPIKNVQQATAISNVITAMGTMIEGIGKAAGSMKQTVEVSAAGLGGHGFGGGAINVKYEVFASAGQFIHQLSDAMFSEGGLVTEINNSLSTHTKILNNPDSYAKVITALGTLIESIGNSAGNLKETIEASGTAGVGKMSKGWGLFASGSYKRSGLTVPENIKDYILALVSPIEDLIDLFANNPVLTNKDSKLPESITAFGTLLQAIGDAAGSLKTTTSSSSSMGVGVLGGKVGPLGAIGVGLGASDSMTKETLNGISTFIEDLTDPLKRLIMAIDSCGLASITDAEGSAARITAVSSVISAIGSAVGASKIRTSISTFHLGLAAGGLALTALAGAGIVANADSTTTEQETLSNIGEFVSDMSQPITDFVSAINSVKIEDPGSDFESKMSGVSAVISAIGTAMANSKLQNSVTTFVTSVIAGGHVGIPLGFYLKTTGTTQVTETLGVYSEFFTGISGAVNSITNALGLFDADKTMADKLTAVASVLTAIGSALSAAKVMSSYTDVLGGFVHVESNETIDYEGLRNLLEVAQQAFKELTGDKGILTKISKDNAIKPENAEIDAVKVDALCRILTVVGEIASAFKSAGGISFTKTLGLFSKFESSIGGTDFGPGVEAFTALLNAIATYAPEILDAFKLYDDDGNIDAVSPEKAAMFNTLLTSLAVAARILGSDGSFTFEDLGALKGFKADNAALPTEEDISNFVTFVSSIKEPLLDFGDAISGTEGHNLDASKIDAMSSLAIALGSFVAMFPKDDLLTRLFGTQSVLDIDKVTSFITAIANGTGEIALALGTNGANAATLAAMKPLLEGFVAFVEGLNDIANFSYTINNFGAIDWTGLSNAFFGGDDGSKGLVDIITEFSDKLKGNKVDITAIGNVLRGVGDIVTAISKDELGDTTHVAEVAGVIDQLCASIERYAQLGALQDQAKSANKTVSTVMNGLPKESASATATTSTSVDNAGSTMAQEFSDSFNSDESQATMQAGVSAALTNISYFAQEVIAANQFVIAKAGVYYLQGISEGLNDPSAQGGIYNTIRDVAQKMLDELQTGLHEASPSKATKQMGKYFDEGLAIGIRDNTGMVVGATETLADSTLAGFKTATMALASISDDITDIEPRITPVLDTSNVERGLSTIPGLMSNPLSVKTLGNISAINSTMKSGQNGVSNADVVDAIDGLGRKIAASRGDVYNIDGVSYGDDSAISAAVKNLTDAVVMEGRK